MFDTCSISTCICIYTKHGYNILISSEDIMWLLIVSLSFYVVLTHTVSREQCQIAALECCNPYNDFVPGCTTVEKKFIICVCGMCVSVSVCVYLSVCVCTHVFVPSTLSVMTWLTYYVCVTFADQHLLIDT